MWIHTGSLNMRPLSFVIAIAAASIAVSACGGSDDDDDSSGGNAATMEAPKVLTANTAGKACAADKDCGTGACKKELTIGGGFLGPTTTPAPGGYCSFNCRLDADCGSGGVCLGANSTGGFGFGNAGGQRQAAMGQCLARCDSSTQCREGYRCLDTNGRALESGNASAAANASGSCQVAPETDTVAPGVVGAQCAANEDCSGGTCMTTTQAAQFPGGYCTGRCLANSDCGEGAECAAGFGGTGTCYKTCSADTECREGYRCRTAGFGQGGSKRCIPGADPLADGVVGKACTADAECGGAAMSCVTTTGNAALPGGYCSVSCVDNVDCGAGGVCIGGVGGAATGYCYKSCATATDCRQGYACEDLSFGGAAGMGMSAAAPMLVCTLPLDTGNGQDAGM